MQSKALALCQVGLTLEMKAFKLFTEANFYVINSMDNILIALLLGTGRLLPDTFISANQV